MARFHASPSTPACSRRDDNGQPIAPHRPGPGQGQGPFEGTRRQRRRQTPACCALLPPPGNRPQRPAIHRPEPRRLTPEQQAFAARHLGLARQQARRFALRHRLDYDDLLGAAYEGLCKAALGFDPSLGHQPSSYVVPKVKGALLHHLRDTGFALRICHRYRELWIKARRLVALELRDQQIADALRVPVGVWVDVRLACGVAPVPLGLVLREGVEFGVGA